jgi:hypothetical protein
MQAVDEQALEMAKTNVEAREQVEEWHGFKAK